MPNKAQRLFALAVALAAAAGLSSCGDTPTAPSTPAAGNAPASSLLGGLISWPWSRNAELIECPSTESQTTSAVIDASGGAVSLGGTRVLLPAYAVLAPTTIELTIPASKYMEVEVTANGGEHFLFRRAILVTVDYSRCGAAADGPLSVWYIDSDSKELLQRMLSLDNKLTRSVTFVTGHLSGYALAN